MSAVEVSRDALIDVASRLVRIPSFCPDETPVARFLEGYFRERGYEVQLQEVEPGRFQTIATWRGTGGGRSLMLNGHLDINSLARGWTRDPFEPWIDGDRLYGHGVQNMKGGVATMIEAVEALRRVGHRPRGDIVLACVAGETQGGEGSRYLAEHGPRADMAVLPEPYGLGHLVTVHGGIVHLAIHTYGVTGHISQIEQTVSAVVKMTRVVQALQSVRFTFEPHPALPALPRLNVGSIIGGRGERYVLVEPPYVPDLCTAIVDVHFVPGQTVESIVADLRRTLEPLRAADPELRYEIEIPPPAYFKGSRRLVMQPVDVPVDTEVVRTVARHHAAVTGTAPAVVGALLPMSYSAGDASWLWGTARIPSVYYGPGGGFLEPGPGGSYALISEMVACAKVLALTALDVTA